MSVTGKVAIVTGAAMGLGKAFCKILLENGAKVFMTDVNEAAAQVTLKEFQAQFGVNVVTFMKCDVSSKQQMEDAFKATKEKFGGLDIVCNNAGIGGETDPLWEKAVDINLKGCIRGTHLALQYMRQDQGGRGGVIVNISSMAGLNPNPFGPVYCATKHAIVGFSRSVAMFPETAQNGVRINILCPAFVDTNLVSSLAEENCLSVSKAKIYAHKDGLMTPDYVAEGFLELVTDNSKNGAILKMGKTFGKVYHETSRA
ncbi:15-hydroxyprostaglandin dehydrogenase [NAD(+)] [Patella vulgata]|uniref:15-hydroxyprostaglandin dehydrogenase [NAD(+)] n=1 Tax=Patella vulgata TaxID=6465 RepID=UPI0024A86813|nr:15-hydroxyprostaglandin dehydrogenase [NAD(+)] [Patella vulgata]